MIECNANEAGRFVQPSTDAGAGSGALRCWLNDVVMLLATTGSLVLPGLDLVDLTDWTSFDYFLKHVSNLLYSSKP